MSFFFHLHVIDTTTTTLPAVTEPRATTGKTTRKTPTTSTRASPCQHRNMTVYVKTTHERAFVEITPDVKSELSVGTHVMYIAGCIININVKVLGM